MVKIIIQQNSKQKTTRENFFLKLAHALYLNISTHVW